jgi:TonB family protein
VNAAVVTAANVIAQSIAAFTLHALWQVPLLAGAAWCAVRVGRPQARIAHVVWVGTLLLCVVLPVGSTIAARHAAFEAERAAAAASISYESMAYAGDLQPMQRMPVWKRMLHRHVNTRDGLQPFSFAITQRWARIITAAWLLVMAFFSAQLFIGWTKVRALVRGATDNPLPDEVATALQQQCERLHLPAPAIKLHDGIAGPVLAGVMRPTLLLPADSANEMGCAEVAAVLAHELAHLRRRDPLMHAACSLLLVPVGFHPAALWAARCVRQTREMACDAEAADHIGSSADYAWALLQVAERTSTDRGQAAAAGLFSNGLFGAGLQLFTNRGAMEERMQMLMNGNKSNVRGRAVRVAAGVSLAAAAVVAATMLQVQPTLAAERSLPQAAAATQQAATAPAQTTQESEPSLIGGEHAREQLRRAQRQLRQAESTATNPEDRKKIAGAQEAIAAAQQALNAVDGSPRIHLDLSELDRLNLQLKGMKLPNAAALQDQMNAQREAMQKLQVQLNSPEWKAQMQRMQRDAMESARVQMNSPEFKAQIEQARNFDRTKIDAMMAEARKQQEKAMEQIRSGAIQRQIAEAQLMARVEPPAMPNPAAAPAPLPAPAPVASPSPSSISQLDPDKPVRISPNVMAGNKIGGSDPVYPATAKEKHIQGTVVLHAIINKTGKVESIQVASSPDDSLSKSAVAAVETWTYRPYLLNGNPMAVDTTVNVNFSLMQ